MHPRVYVLTYTLLPMHFHTLSCLFVFYMHSHYFYTPISHLPPSYHTLLPHPHPLTTPSYHTLLPQPLTTPSLFPCCLRGRGMQELKDGMASVVNGGVAVNKVFAHPLPYNIIPHIDVFQDNLYTKEEMKVCMCASVYLSLCVFICVLLENLINLPHIFPPPHPSTAFPPSPLSSPSKVT